MNVNLKNVPVNVLLTIHPGIIDQRDMWCEFIEQVIMADVIYPFGDYVTHRTDELDTDKHCRVLLGSVVAGRIDHYLYFQHCRHTLIQGWPHWVTHPTVRALVEMNSITEATSMLFDGDKYQIMAQQQVEVLGTKILTDVNIGHLSVNNVRPTDDEWDMYLALAEVFLSQKRDEYVSLDFSYN